MAITDTIESKVLKFAKPATSVVYPEEVYCTISRSDIVALNKIIEPKIRQNEQERTASMYAAARCIVGGK